MPVFQVFRRGGAAEQDPATRTPPSPPPPRISLSNTRKLNGSRTSHSQVSRGVYFSINCEHGGGGWLLGKNEGVWGIIKRGLRKMHYPKKVILKWFYQYLGNHENNTFLMDFNKYCLNFLFYLSNIILFQKW